MKSRRLFCLTYRLARLLTRPLHRDRASRALDRMFPAVAEVHGHVMHLVPGDQTILARSLRRRGRWERNLTDVMLERVRPGSVVVDAGANVGYYTLLFARAVGPTGLVYAFEPEPRNFAILSRNVAENGYQDRVRLVRKALLAEPGVVRLFSSETNLGAHSVNPIEGAQGSIEVEATTLDRELPAERPPALLKIDCEGAELTILKGAARILARSDLTVFFELSPDRVAALGGTAGEALDLLRSGGFDVGVVRRSDVLRGLDNAGVLAACAERGAGHVDLICTKGAARATR